MIGRTFADEILADEILTGALAGYDIRRAASSDCSIKILTNADLVIVGPDGSMTRGVVVLCQRIRAYCPNAVVVVAHADSSIDTVAILDAGSDDCIDFRDKREGLSRVSAAIRRACRSSALGEPAYGSTVVSRAGLQIDPKERSVKMHEKNVSLTRREFDLLYHLASRPGTVMSRGRLMREVWRVPADENLKPNLGRTVDTHVSLLRSKLGDRRWIETVRGVGFCFSGRPPAQD